jgi:hypothetical protein
MDSIKFAEDVIAELEKIGVTSPIDQMFVGHMSRLTLRAMNTIYEELCAQIALEFLVKHHRPMQESDLSPGMTVGKIKLATAFVTLKTMQKIYDEATK